MDRFSAGQGSRMDAQFTRYVDAAGLKCGPLATRVQRGVEFANSLPTKKKR